MAKVKGPLFSMDARGQIGKTLVYLGWKGLKTVRSYVVPANPNSADQQTQRGYFGDAVSLWQTAGFTSDDVSAWNKLALAVKTVASGFNMFVKHYLTQLVAGNAWTTLSNVVVSSITDTGATITADIASDETTKIYYGTSLTNMRESDSLVFGTGDTEVDLTGLSASTTYYFYLINEEASEGARTGIYEFTTAAA